MVGQAALAGWDIIVGGSKHSPVGVYLASGLNSGTGAWAAAAGSLGTLTLQAGSPTYDVRSPFDAGEQADEGVTGDGTAYWTAASGPALGTKDWLLLIAATTPASGECIFATRDSGDGLSVAMASATVLRCVFDAGSAYNIDAPAAVAGQINVWGFAGDRSGNATAWLNATAGTPVDISADAATDVTDEDVFTLMADGAGANDCNGTLFAVALYQGAGMLGADTAAVVKQLTMRFAGLYGRSGPTEASLVPTVTRATAAGHSVTRSGDARLWQVGAGLLAADDKGVGVWGEATNLVLGSNLLDNATYWQPDAAAASAPKTLGHESAIGIVGTAFDTQHFFQQANVFAVAASTQYTVSVVFEAGDQSHAQIAPYDGSNVWRAYYHLSGDGSVSSTEGSPDASGITPLGNGRYLCWMTFTTAVGSANIRLYLIACEADGDSTFTGDGSTVNTYIWGDVQFELGAVPTPFIRTAGAAATRNATVLEYPIAAVPFAGPFTIEFPFTLPDHTPDAARYLFSISDGTTDHHLSASVATDGSLDIDSNESGGDAGHVDIAGDYADGDEHILRVALGGGVLMARVDHGAIGSDTSATHITAVDSFNVGRRYDDTLYTQGHIDVGRMKIYKGVRL